MENKLVYLYVLNTLADWEPGYALAELNTGRFFKKDAPALTVKTVGSTKEAITTMGGIQIYPDYALDEILINNAALLILPGGDIWHEPVHQKVMEVVQVFLATGIPVAAICGATVALAQTGILNKYQHTSNDLSYLKEACPNYTGQELYVHNPAVTDGNLITATGLAPLKFAYEIIKKLEVFSTGTLEAWFQLHRTREPRYFNELFQSLPNQAETIKN